MGGSMEGTHCILVSHLSLVQIWWDGALTWRLGREVLMHTAETSKAWDSLLPEAQEKLLRENELTWPDCCHKAAEES